MRGNFVLTCLVVSFGCVAFGVPMETSFAPAVEFFSAFNDYAVGTSLTDSTLPTAWSEVGVFVNRVKGAYYAKVNSKGTGGLTVLADAPGKYIYSSLAATRPCAVDPRGIRHEFNGSGNAVYIFMNSMGTPLGTNTGHTVEMFFKLDRDYSVSTITLYYDPYHGDNQNRVIVWLPKNSKNKLLLKNQGSAAPIAGDEKYATYEDLSTLVNDGHWHHFAVVYKAEWEGVKLYCDYTLVSDIVKVDIDANTSQMRIGDNSNGFPGLTSAVRVSTIALEPSGFMRASNNSNGPSPNTENYLYPFNEEAVGTTYSAGSFETLFKGYNPQGDIAVSSYVMGVGTNEVCAASPGRYLYSDVYSKVPIATDIKSVHQHNPDLNSNASYGILKLVSGSHRLARYGSYTLEFFWKMDTFHNSLDMAYWDMVKETSSPACMRRFALLMGASTQTEFIRLWTAANGDDAPASQKVEVPYAGYTTTSGKETGLADGLWHHVAVTYDGTTRQARLFCDYALVGSSAVSLGDLTGLELPKSTCELRYGGYKWSSYLSAVRLSKGVLTPDRFLYASDSPDGALPKAGVTWWLDGTNGVAVADTNVALTARQYVHTIAAGAKGDTTVSGTAVYTNDYAYGRRVINGVRGRANLSAATLTPGSSLRSSGLGPLVSSASAFTVQALVKLDARPASGVASILAQADESNGYAWSLSTKTDGVLAFRAKLVEADGTTSDWELASSVPLPLGDWHHVAVTCDKESGAVKLYLDQTEVASSASTGGQLLCGDGALVAGAVGTLETIQGGLDEVIFNREILAPCDFQEIVRSGFSIIFQ